MAPSNPNKDSRQLTTIDEQSEDEYQPSSPQTPRANLASKKVAFKVFSFGFSTYSQIIREHLNPTILLMRMRMT